MSIVVPLPSALSTVMSSDSRVTPGAQVAAPVSSMAVQAGEGVARELEHRAHGRRRVVEADPDLIARRGAARVAGHVPAQDQRLAAARRIEEGIEALRTGAVTIGVDPARVIVGRAAGPPI